MALEFGVDDDETAYKFAVNQISDICRLHEYPVSSAANELGNEFQPNYELDWEPVVKSILEDISANAPVSLIAARFHNGLACAIAKVAQLCGRKKVLLTGGCFLNRKLTEKAVQQLTVSGFSPYCHQRVPPGDGGISLGQIIAVSRTASIKLN